MRLIKDPRPFSRQEIQKKFEDLRPEVLSELGIHRICCDILFCWILYGASLSDYVDYDFVSKNHFERKQFVTDRKRLSLWRKFNGNQFDLIFRNKYLTYQAFRPFYSREVISFDDIDKTDFRKFCAKKKQFFLKPIDSCSGIGAKMVELIDSNRVDELFESYTKTPYLAEEVIEQHEVLAEFHPRSVNTIRINTVVTQHDTRILGAALRLGVGEDIVDNYTTGGLITAIDIDSGVVFTAGRDVRLNWHDFHPDSKKQIIGFEIPGWSRVKKFACALAEVMPQARFIGWDIALAKDGTPVLVEGNIHSTFLQVADQVGKMKLYNEALKDW
jgi:hypothetical protein